MLDRGDISTSGKCLPKSSICVIDKGELFSLTLMLILSQEIKKICILLRLCSLLLLDQSILYYGHNLLFMKSLLFPCNSIVLHSTFLQISLNASDVLKVLSSRKLKNYCMTCSTNMMAHLGTVRRNIATKFSKDF